MKTKPTQHSVNEPRRIGIHPDVIVCRSHRGALGRRSRTRSRSSPTSTSAPSSGARTSPMSTSVPAVLQEQGLDQLVVQRLGIDVPPAVLGEWRDLIDRIGEPSSSKLSDEVTIALVGKYVLPRRLPLRARGAQARRRPPGRAGTRAVGRRGGHVLRRDGRAARAGRRRPRAGRFRLPRLGGILARQVARERGIPYLGICLGMHVAVSEFARHVGGLEGANSTEMDPETPFPVIDLLLEQKEIEDLGGTMRLGAQAVEARRGHAHPGRSRRSRHPRAPPPVRGEQPVPRPADRSRARRPRHLPGGASSSRSSSSPSIRGSSRASLHLEFKSRPTRPAPLFREFVGAALERACTAPGRRRLRAIAG